jgi:hypothetical protein
MKFVYKRVQIRRCSDWEKRRIPGRDGKFSVIRIFRIFSGAHSVSLPMGMWSKMAGALD